VKELSNNSGEFVVVCMRQAIAVGTRFTQWPLHLTLVPWFTAPDIETVQAALEPVLRLTSPFTVDVGDRAYFGQRKLPVKLLKPSPQLHALHGLLLSKLEEQGWPITGRYTGQHYKPHITQKAGLDAEGEFVIGAVYIAKALPQNYRQIVARLEFDHE
jgi:2'-5' RNA ligase